VRRWREPAGGATPTSNLPAPRPEVGALEDAAGKNINLGATFRIASSTWAFPLPTISENL